MRNRICWTLVECKQIAKFMFDCGVREGDRDFLTSIAVAQKATLSPDRHRHITTRTQASTVVEELRELVRVDVENKAKEAAKLAEQQKAVEPADVDLNALVDGLANMMAMKFGEIFKEALKRHIKNGVEAVPEVKQVVDKKTIVIGGLLPVQAGMIDSEYGSRFKLKFVDANASARNVREMAEHADMTISMVGKNSHSVEEALSRNDCFMRVSGLMTALRKTLDNIA